MGNPVEATVPQPARRGPLRPLWVLAPAGAVAVVVVALGAYGYARTDSSRIAHGVFVGPVSLGGLSRTGARARLSRWAAGLAQPVTIRAGRRRVRLSLRSAHPSVDVAALAQRALHAGRRGSVITRAVRGLTGGSVSVVIQPQVAFRPGALRRLLKRAQSRLGRPVRNASIVPGPVGVKVRTSAAGLAVDQHALRQALLHSALASAGQRAAAVPLHRVRPALTIAQLRRRYPAFITVDRAHFTLRVYQHLRLARTYPIAVGQVGLQTPAGLYHIQNKAVNPAWNVPRSAWAGSLAGQLIPPGPQDPLKARWLGIFNGAGIHGTEETWSIGHAVSHGCIRMTIADVIDLYKRVRVGTPIYIGG